MRKAFLLIALMATTLLFFGCSNDDDNSNPIQPQPGNAYVRVGHLSPDAPAVDIWVDGSVVLQDVVYGQFSDYLTLPATAHRIQVSPANQTAPIVIDENVTLVEEASYTIAAVGLLAGIEALVVADDRSGSNRMAKVRFVHTSADAPAVDVAVTGGTVLFSNTSFTAATNYITVTPGVYDLEVRLAGTMTVVLNLPDVALTANTNYSVFATGLVGNNTLGAQIEIDHGTPAGFALVRIGHLSPDAPNVDVWVDGQRVLDNVAFSDFSGYLQVLSGNRSLQISVAGSNPPQIVLDETLALISGNHYTVAAMGLVGNNSLNTVVLIDDITIDNSQARIRFVHASPDAPNVDIAIAGGGSILYSNVPFGSAGNYLAVAASQYVLDVLVAGTSTVALRVPAVQLGAGAVFTIFAIGQAGNGTLNALPVVDAGTPGGLPMTDLRVGHLSPDAPNVDVWVDGGVALQNVPFRTISGYLGVTAGMHWIQVTPTGVTQPVVIDEVLTLNPDMNYTVAATGLLGDNSLVATVYIDDVATSASQARVRFIHTSPDAPSVDIAVAGGPVLFNNVSFPSAGSYLSVDAGAYVLDVLLAGTSTRALRIPNVLLGTNATYTIFATGLASDGSLSALAIIDAGTPGGLSTAEVRVAHLSPDAPNVDVWVNRERVLQNVSFQTVSGYLNVNAGQHWIQITPAGATEPVVIDAVVSFGSGEAYTVAATGLIGSNDLQPLVLLDDRTTVQNQAKVRFVHTSPDAPAVDVAVQSGPVLFADVVFREASSYLSVAAQSYDLEVRLAGTETVALSVPGVALEINRNYTVFAIGLAGNGTLAALPVIDQSGQ